MSDPLKNAVMVALEEAGSTRREADYAMLFFRDGLEVTKNSVRELVKQGLYFIELLRDKGRIGTIAYEGNAYFWSHKYRFWMRGEAHESDYKGISIGAARRLIHKKFMDNNLELSGETELHDKIIDEVFSKNGNENPNYSKTSK